MVVSLDKNSNRVPIKILRDTGATQSLLLEGVLPLGESTSTGESVLAQMLYIEAKANKKR